MVERTCAQRLRFSDWDTDEVRFLVAMGFSYPAIAEMVGCSPDQVYRLVNKHDLKTPLSKSEVTLLGSWHNYRDLARRKTRPGVSNVAAAYLAERMTRIAQELRRTEAHIEKFKRGRDAGSPVGAADALPLEALPDDELYARLEKLVGGLATPCSSWIYRCRWR